MQNKNGIKILTVRLIMLITTLIIFLYITYVWMFDPDREALIEFLELPVPDVLMFWQILLGYILSLLPVFAMAYGFYWVNKFFNTQASNNPSKVLAITVKRFGLSQIYFWASLLIVDFFIPLIIQYYNATVIENIEIPLPIDPTNILLVNGIVLLMIAKLIYKATKVHEENQEFI